MACPQSTWRKSGSRQKSVASGGCDSAVVVAVVTVVVAAVISDMVVLLVVQEVTVAVTDMVGGCVVNVEKNI
jgi:hypothetical protein